MSLHNSVYLRAFAFFIHYHFVTCNVHTRAFPCMRGLPQWVWYSIDSSTLKGGRECFKAKARHVKEINVPLLSPALIRALLSAENDRACSFHYVFLLMSGVPHPSLVLVHSLMLAHSFFILPLKKMLLEANANLPAKYLFVGCKWWGVSAILRVFSQASFLFFVSHSWLLRKIWQNNWHIFAKVCTNKYQQETPRWEV